MPELIESSPFSKETIATEKPRASQRGSWAAFLAAALLLPFANGAYSIPIAAFLAPLFLLRFTRTYRPMVGIIAALILQSIAVAIQFRGMIPVPGPVLVFIILYYAFLLTVPYGVDRWIAPRLRGWLATLIFPCAWVSIEYLTSFMSYGSWISPGYALHGNLPLLQLLALTGLWGLTFLIGWVAAAGNRAWELGTNSSGAVRAAGLTVAVPIVVALLGGARLAIFPPGARTVRIASLSRIDTKLHPDPKVMARFFAQKPLTAEEVEIIRSNAVAIDSDLLKRAYLEAQSGARIIFWGESNAPVLSQDEPDLLRRGTALARSSGIYLGMALAAWHMDSKPPLENKLVLFKPDGNVAWEYYKAHPVPGGEAAMSITRDGKLRSLDTPYGRITSVICFDADFPRLLAQAGAMRADLVLDPSNDWPAIDPWHTHMASYRAIEQGVNFVRHTSQGLSAAYDYEGRTLATMDHYSATDRTMVSQVPTHGVRTLYSLLGDWFAWLSLAGLAVLVVKRG